MIRKLLLATALLASSPSNYVSAQMKIPSEVTCARCAILIEKGARLESAEISNEPFVLARDNVGNIFYYAIKERHIKVFAPSGMLVGKISREGGGPGETRMVRNIIVAEDQSLHVIDGVLSRRSVFDRAGNFLRSNPIPLSLGGMGRPAILLKDGRLVISAVLRDAASAGFALQVVDGRGLRTALLDEATYSNEHQWLLARKLAPSRDGGFWVANTHKLQIDRYNRALTRTGQWTRDAEWLVPTREGSEGPSDGVHDRPPTSLISHIWEDAEGVLWVHFLVASPDWRPGPTVAQASKQKIDFLSLVQRPRYDSVLEAIDPQSMKVISRVRTLAFPEWPIGNGYYADFDDSSGGEPLMTIIHVHLKR